MSDPIKNNIRDVYEKHAQGFDEKIAGLSIYNETYDHLLALLPDHAAILDLACGPGNVTAYLKKQKPGLSVVGVDISEKMLAIARRRHPDGLFFISDISNLAIGTTFDCIICAFAIPYLDPAETDRVAGLIHRQLADEGIFYLSFMAGEGAGYAKTSFTDTDELYIYLHTEADVRAVLEKNALTVDRKFEIDYPEMDGTTTREFVLVGEKKPIGR
jgi:SAM-dependent methyltransferase